jgi:hypothetical protein
MPMQQLSKHVRKLLREAAGSAYQKELSAELEKLHGSFERWRRGELSPFDLSDEIHRFHQGPNRQLFVRYTDNDPLLAVAGAVSAGILRLDELDPELHPHVVRVSPVFEARGSES